MWWYVREVLLRWMLMWFGSDRVCGARGSVGVGIGIGVVVLRSRRNIGRRVLVFRRGRPVVVGLTELEGRFFVSIHACSIRFRRPQCLPSRGRGAAAANAAPSPREMVVVKRRRMDSIGIRIRICVHPIGTRSPIRITRTRLIRVISIQMMRVHIRIRPPMARPTGVVRCRWRVL